MTEAPNRKAAAKSLDTPAQVWEFIQSDLYRYTGRVAPSALARALLLNPSFRYTLWLRMSKLSVAPLRIFARLMHRRLSHKFLMQIPSSVRLGYGLRIPHHMCIVINSSATIGDNCTIGQFTTIGSGRRRAATIGNNVFIGPGVSIIEDVRIGDGATIGAGAVVVRDVPPGATVAGNPARVISDKAPGRLVKHPWGRADTEL